MALIMATRQRYESNYEMRACGTVTKYKAE
jgi:hypothetical protein